MIFFYRNDESVFLTWETEFSNDASLNEIQDSKYKKLDAFKDLQMYLDKVTSGKQVAG